MDPDSRKMSVNLRPAMDVGFWDLNVSTPQVLGGTARWVPGEPAPVGLARSGRSVRPFQLAFLSQAFPLGIIPSLAPVPSHKELGSFSIQSILRGPFSSDWWTALAWQFRPQKLISGLKKEMTSGDELEFPELQDVAKLVLDKSLYSLGMFSHFSLTRKTSLLLNTEFHGFRKVLPSKAVFHHKLRDHDVTLEAAWPELFLDSNGKYWDVPSSISLNIASLLTESGFRHRLSLQKIGGYAESRGPSSKDEIPASLLPGLCAKAAISYEKSRDFWRVKEKKKSRFQNDGEEEEESPWMDSYDVRMTEPHAAVSGIVGGACEAWLLRDEKSRKRPPISVDLFGSLSYTYQHGKFKQDFNDLTRVDARVDVHSASAFIKGVGHVVSGILGYPFRAGVQGGNPLASSRLNVIFQQQVAGPIVFRLDSRVSLKSPSSKNLPCCLEDIMVGLSYSFRPLQSGKVLAWYSPKRKEAMVELRIFEL